jgi:Family of unknown function (DUF6804)
MATIIVKIACAVSLLVGALWVAPPSVTTLLNLVVCVGALAVATQAAASSKFSWAGGFLLISVLFNPVQPIPFPRSVFFWMDLASVVVFMISLQTLKDHPHLPLPSFQSRKH